MGGANRLRQAYEYWQRGDFAMAELHGTREIIGGGELAPHPETAAQTHGRRQPFVDKRMNTSNAGILPRLTHTERVNS